MGRAVCQSGGSLVAVEASGSLASRSCGGTRRYGDDCYSYSGCCCYYGRWTGLVDAESGFGCAAATERHLRRLWQAWLSRKSARFAGYSDDGDDTRHGAACHCRVDSAPDSG